MLKRKRQLQTMRMRKLMWQSKNLLLKVSKLLRKLKSQRQRKEDKLQLLNRLLVKLLLQRRKTPRTNLRLLLA